MVETNELGIFFIFGIFLCITLGRLAFIYLIFIGGMVLSSSAINININGSSYPIMPGNLAAITFSLLNISNTLSYLNKIIKEKSTAWNSIFIFAFILTLSAITLPRLFSGEVLVSNAHDVRNDIFWATLLQPSSTNISQTFYIIEEIFTSISIAAFFSRNKDCLELFLKSLYKINFFVIGLALWEFLSFYFPIPYPYDFLYSSATDTFNPMRYNVSIGDFNTTRIAVTFGEPSQLAPYLAGMTLLCLFTPDTIVEKKKRFFLVYCNVLAMLISMSSTAFGAAILVLLFYNFIYKANALKNRIKIIITVCAISSIILIIVFSILSSHMDIFINFYQDMVFNKLTDFDEHTSAGERLFRDVTALSAFWNTYGLGVGWGSTRASSLIPQILGNVGIIGLLAFGKLLLHLWKIGKTNSNIMPFVGFYIGGIIASSLAVSDFLVYQLYWVAVAVILGSDISKNSSEANRSTPREVAAETRTG